MLNKVSPSTQYEGGLKEGTVSEYMSAEMMKDSIEICKTAKNPVKLSWDNLNYEVEIKVNTKDANAGSRQSYKQ